MKAEQLVRQIEFFGQKGQELLSQSEVVIVGTGGVGSHVAQQLAFLNIGSITIIDGDTLEDSNFNRLIGVNAKDTVSTSKVEIIARNIKAINSDTRVNCIPKDLRTSGSFAAIKKAQFTFSCVDNDGARLVMNDLCLAYEIPFIDVASEILPNQNEYGGHVISVIDNTRCLFCLGEIDSNEARRYLQHPDARKDEAAIYGVDKIELKGGGPSVVSINGVVASMAVTEFFLWRTGIREPNIAVKYLGSSGIVRRMSKHDSSDCYYCQAVRGLKESARVEEQYILKDTEA